MWDMTISVTTNANIIHAENANARKGRYAGAVQVFFFLRKADKAIIIVVSTLSEVQWFPRVNNMGKTSRLNAHTQYVKLSMRVNLALELEG